MRELEGVGGRGGGVKLRKRSFVRKGGDASRRGHRKMMFAFRADVEMLLQHGPGMDRGAAGTFGGSGTRDFTPDHLILPRGGGWLVGVPEAQVMDTCWAALFALFL